MSLYSVTFEKYSETGRYMGLGRVNVEAQHCSQAAFITESQTTRVVDVTHLQSNIPTKKQFDEVVYECGYVYYFAHDKTVKLDGEFSFEAIEIISYAMKNHPEWFKLDDQT